jgi:AraC-like DNA-binding protein
MQNYASKVIAVLLAEVGYIEKRSREQLDDKTANAGFGNYTKYARDLDAIPGFYNGKKQGYAWCDMTVDWGFVQAYGEEEAKRLLLENREISTNIIGELAGFSDRSNFHRQFVRIAGCTPRQWREMHP